MQLDLLNSICSTLLEFAFGVKYNVGEDERCKEYGGSGYKTAERG